MLRTSFTPSTVLTASSALVFSSAVRTLPCKVTRPFTVSTLMVPPRRPSVASRAILALVVIQASRVPARASRVPVSARTAATAVAPIHVATRITLSLQARVAHLAPDRDGEPSQRRGAQAASRPTRARLAPRCKHVSRRGRGPRGSDRRGCLSRARGGTASAGAALAMGRGGGPRTLSRQLTEHSENSKRTEQRELCHGATGRHLRRKGADHMEPAFAVTLLWLVFGGLHIGLTSGPMRT